VPIGLPPPAQAVAWLAAETALSAAQAEVWLAAAGGAPLRARDLLEDGDSSGYRRIVEAFAGLPEAGIAATADALTGIDPVDWAAVAQTWAADLVRVCAGAAPRRHPERLDRLRQLAGATTLGRLTALERRLRALGREASHSLNARLLLEDVLIEFLQALAAPASGLVPASRQPVTRPSTLRPSAAR
jgi:DNA polymerase-3 subunit delta'